jgi:hypothetical protein
MNRATQIALRARMYRLLAERPEYMISDREEVARRLLMAPVTLSDLDRTLIVAAGDELDRVCAHAVRKLSLRVDRGTLDTLSLLDADRLTAIYYALPPQRRAAVRSDVSWAYAVDHAPPDLEGVLALVDGMAADVLGLQTDEDRTEPERAARRDRLNNQAARMRAAVDE